MVLNTVWGFNRKAKVPLQVLGLCVEGLQPSPVSWLTCTEYAIGHPPPRMVNNGDLPHILEVAHIVNYVKIRIFLRSWLFSLLKLYHR